MNTESRSQTAGDIRSARQQRDVLRKQAEVRRQRIGDTLFNKIGVLGSKQSEQAADAQQRVAQILLEEARADRALVGDHSGYVPTFEHPDDQSEHLPEALAVNPFELCARQDAQLRQVSESIAMAAPDIRNAIKTEQGFVEVFHVVNAVLSGEERRFMDAKRAKTQYILQMQDMPVPRQPKGEHGTLTQTMLGVIEDNVDMVKAGIRSNEKIVLKNEGQLGYVVSREALRSILALLIMGDATQVRLANAIVKQDLERFLTVAENGDCYALKQILIFGDQELQQEAEKSVTQKVRERTYPVAVIQALLRTCLDEYNPAQVKRLGNTVIEMITAGAGFSTEKIKAIWDESKSAGDSEATLYPSHAARLYALEQVRPGAAYRLHEQFGITQFNRYPTEALVNQDTATDMDVPYGLVITSRHDQGVFESAMTNASKVIDQIIAQLGGKIHVRIIEVGGRIGLVKKHLQLDERYGDQHKCLFSVNIAHGQPDSMKYSKEQKGGTVTIADLDGPAAQAVLQTYDPKAEHVLISCLTGKPGGIAQKLSKRSGRRVLAPRESIEMPDVTVEINDQGNVHFEVVYPAEQIKAEYLGGEPQ